MEDNFSTPSETAPSGDSAPPSSAPASETPSGATSGHTIEGYYLNPEKYSQVHNEQPEEPEDTPKLGYLDPPLAATRPKEQRNAQPAAPKALEKLSDHEQIGFKLNAQHAPQPVTPAAPQYDPATLLGDLSAERGHEEFLERLYDSNYDAYERIVNHIVEQHADYFAEKLGHHRPVYGLSSEELASIPEHLHETASTMRADLWEQLSWMPAAQRNAVLEGARELEELRQQTTRHQSQQIQSSYQQSAQKMHQEYESQLREKLDEWSPLGADLEGNRVLRDAAWFTVMQDMAKTPVQEGNRIQVHEYLQDAAVFRAQGNYQAAEQCEYLAKEKAERWSKSFAFRLERHMNALGRAYQQQAPSEPTKPPRVTSGHQQGGFMLDTSKYGAMRDELRGNNGR